MKLTTKYSWVVLAAWSAAVMAEAAAPPTGSWHAASLDRPTPPPCCADGVCYAHPTTFGWYPTRWRRWPGVFDPVPEPDPAELPPDRYGPEIPPYDTPPPEEEDRRAPPPTRPRPEREPIDEDLEPEAPRMPGVPPDGRPIPGPPMNGAPLNDAMPPPMPWDEPLEPMSDADPPPAPPLAVRSHWAKGGEVRPVAARQTAARNGPGARTPRSANEPPGAMPIALDRRH